MKRGESLAEEQSEAYPKMQDGEGHGSDQSSEKDLLMKLLAMMILSWQATFNWKCSLCRVPHCLHKKYLKDFILFEEMDRHHP